nr:unnamed protein product [Callosobruchus analis]
MASKSKPEMVSSKAMSWWDKRSIQYAFSHPQIRCRLEKLMGSHIVSLTNRQYMQTLQERILDEYAEAMDKRIKNREEEELERVKNLVLIGKIPFSQAPAEMANHPVMLIEKYCNKLIAERRAKIKVYKVKIPTYLYSDDTPDPESGLAIEKGHVFSPPSVKLCQPYERFLPPEPVEDEEGVVAEGEEPEVDEYMIDQEKFDLMYYEDPLVKQLKSCETIEELYELADEIIGFLRCIDDKERANTRRSTLIPAEE